MWCLTDAESEEWFRGCGRPLATGERPDRLTGRYDIVIPLSDLKWSKLSWFAKMVAEAVEPFDNCLMWVTQWGVWESENWHLFYRLRETYGERRLLQDAPGLLFLQHESADLSSFIELALVFGWDFYLVPNRNHVAIFVSHDEFLHFYTESDSRAKELRQMLETSKLEVTITEAKMEST